MRSLQLFVVRDTFLVRAVSISALSMDCRRIAASNWYARHAWLGERAKLPFRTPMNLARGSLLISAMLSTTSPGQQYSNLEDQYEVP
jgi:hypothetical protein